MSDVPVVRNSESVARFAKDLVTLHPHRELLATVWAYVMVPPSNIDIWQQ